MKDFLLIANKNCATYKEVFPLFKDGIVSFGSPVKEYEGTDKKFGNHGWITTLTVPHQKKLVLTATYDPELYPKYDNYNAIEVSRVKNIPYDYEGVMGVPITILDYDLDNVEVTGLYCDSRADGYGLVNGTPTYVNEGHPKWQGPVVDGKAKYCWVLIKKKIEVIGIMERDDMRKKIYTKEEYSNANDLNRAGVYFIDGKPKTTYMRVLIKTKVENNPQE